MKKLAEVWVLGVLLFAFVVASCGGGAAGDDTTTAPSDDITGSTATTTAVVPGGDDDGDSVGPESLSSTCLEATQGMAAAVSAYSTGMAQAFGGSLDDESLQLTADQLEAMAEAAPEEIKDDLGVIAAQLGDFYTALAETGYEPGSTPDADQLAQLSALAESIDNEAFEEASDNMNAWFAANC